ncbi:hypothetical protein N9M66_05600 [Litoreibacter sp.]|nr:hypothetical protein [Litoreibacter sp.]
MNEIVWLSRATSDTYAYLDLYPEILEHGYPDAPTIEDWSRANSRNLEGEVLDQSFFPTKIFHDRPEDFKGRIPPIVTNNTIYVNEKLADVLKSVNLGQGALYPLQAFQHDRITPIEEILFSLNIGNAKETVVVEKSKNIQQPWPGVDVYAKKISIADDDLVVTKNCLEGSDIWADPRFFSAFFFSDNLMKKLQKAELKNALRPLRCQVG